MLLIQQSSSSFRVWTSRALMVYLHRALLFLVVSPRQYINNNHCLLEQQQKVYFSDAEDDEEILMIDDKRKHAEVLFDRNENNSNRIEISQSKQHLLKKYVFKKLSQGLNNSMRKSIQNDTTNSPLIESIDESFSDSSSLLFDAIQLPVTKQFELPTCYSNQTPNSFNNMKINANKIPDNSVYQYQVNPSYSSRQQAPINYHNQTDIPLSYDPYFNNTNSMLSYPSCPSCLPLSSVHHSFDNKTLSSESNESSLSKSLAQYSSASIQQNLSESSDDEDDIYEKYQTSFSHILHQTKSLHTIRKEDKLQSMLVLEPNTSIITIRQLTYHPLNPNNMNYSITTSHIRVRLIANQIDLSIQCDIKPIGCKKPLFNNIIKSILIKNEQKEKSNLKNSLLTLTDQFNHQQSSNKKLQATSILIDIPYKTLYIDS